jgi:hypothetical protein
MIEVVKGFWEDVVTGNIYVVESDTFGKITGGVGPLKQDQLKDLDDYDCKPDILEWLEEAVKKHKLRRFNPSRQN